MRLAGPAAVALALLLLACASVPAGTSEWQGSRDLGATTLRVIVRHSDEGMARTAIGEALDAAEATSAKLRVGIPGSEIDLLGKVPSHLWVEVSQTTWEVLRLAASIAEASDGAYDYTWPPLQKPWGLREGDAPRVPRAFEIETALRRVDWEDVEIRDENGLAARRLTRRTAIDLGSLAHGAAIDSAVARLRDLGVVAARADAGPVHRVFGGTTAHPWRVELRELTLVLRDAAVAEATRGAPLKAADGALVYRKLDPRDGNPVESRWAVVTAPRADAAAGWAEAVLALGAEAPAVLGGHPELAATIAAEGGAVWRSDSFPVADD